MRIINSILITILVYNLSLLSQTVSEDIVAKVNNEPIYASEFARVKSQLLYELSQAAQKPSDEELKKLALDRLITEKLLLKEAEKEKIKVSEAELNTEISNIKRKIAIDENGRNLKPNEIDTIFEKKIKEQNMTSQQFKEEIRKRIIIDKLLDLKIRPRVKQPTDEEIKNFFDNIEKFIKNPDELAKLPNTERDFYSNIIERIKDFFGERVRYRQILIRPLSYNEVDKKKALEKAKAIYERLIKGEDFEDLAEKESDDISAKNGGDMGYVIKGSLPEKLEKEVFSLNVGDISQPIWTDFGYHIIQIVEKKMEEKPKLFKIKQDLANILVQKKFNDEVNKYLNEIKSNAKIDSYLK